MTLRSMWKKFWGHVLKSAPVRVLVALVIAMPIWFVYFTSRKKITNYETFKKYRAKPAIFLFWHGRMMMLSPIVCMGRMKSFVMASQHTDGRMMATVERMFGLRAIYGSSSAGAVSVLRAAVRVLEQGNYSVCISPDGPSGPSFRVKSGALYIAKMTGAPIIPVCFSASRARFIKNWDSFCIAMPFSRVTCRVGDPIFIPSDISDQDFEKKRREIEDIMVAQVREMDGEFGHPPLPQDLRASQVREQRRAARAARKAARTRLS